MRFYIAGGAILLVILNALLLVPGTGNQTGLIVTLSIAVAAVILVVALTGSKSSSPIQAAATAVPAAAPVPIPPPVAAGNQAEAEIVAFFGLLQEKGRLVDFLMEDITSYQDSEVGAAARVIHQGCRQVLQEYFQVSAISEAQEGTQVTVPVGYSADQYRLVGKLTGEPPFTGTLIHKGWKTGFVKLPRIVAKERLPAIAPAEVELK